MPDSRTHRGPHPRDRELFESRHVPALRAATEDLSWLLSRGYNPVSALKLCGDRYALTARQREAVSRAACSDAARERRVACRVEPRGVQELWIDGFNVLLTLEVALGGGPVFVCRDGALRDIASVHGTYRKVLETEPAVQLLTEALLEWKIPRVRLLLDAPVSNSGRLAEVVREAWRRTSGEPRDWQALLVRDADEELLRSGQVVASADGAVLDGAAASVNVAFDVVERRVPGAFWVDLRGDELGGRPTREPPPTPGASGVR